MDVHVEARPPMPPEARLVGIFLVLLGAFGLIAIPVHVMVVLAAAREQILSQLRPQPPGGWLVKDALYFIILAAVLVAGVALLRRRRGRAGGQCSRCWSPSSTR